MTDPFMQGILGKLAEHGILGLAVIFLIYVVIKQYETNAKLNAQIHADSEAKSLFALELQKSFTDKIVEMHKEATTKSVEERRLRDLEVAELRRYYEQKLSEAQRQLQDASETFGEKAMECQETMRNHTDRMAATIDRLFPYAGARVSGSDLMASPHQPVYPPAQGPYQAQLPPAPLSQGTHPAAARPGSHPTLPAMPPPRPTKQG